MTSNHVRTERLSGVVSLVLAGGQGERLYPLTRDRAKPAVPFGGSFRLIDFTLSNCLNSGIRRIHILTQYKSDSLYRHIRLGWDVFNPSIGEYVEVNPPQLRLTSHWYLGTADAIHQNIYTLDRERPEQVLVLSGDHIYRMDYAPLLRQHAQTKADLTIAAMPVPVRDAMGLGVVRVDEDMRALSFEEKPANPKTMPQHPQCALCSMGVYVFKTETLVRRVIEDSKRASSHDFGRDVIPAMIQAGDRVYAYSLDSAEGPIYWRDIGTLDAYWQANMDLLGEPALFELLDPDWPIRTYAPSGMPAKISVGPASAPGPPAEVCNSLISSGSVIRGACVYNSIIGRGVSIDQETRIHESVIMDRVRVGRGVVIRRAIVDKGNSIPDGFRIGVDLEEDAHHFSVSAGGVVVVPKEMPLVRS